VLTVLHSVHEKVNAYKYYIWTPDPNYTTTVFLNIIHNTVFLFKEPSWIFVWNTFQRLDSSPFSGKTYSVQPNLETWGSSIVLTQVSSSFYLKIGTESSLQNVVSEIRKGERLLKIKVGWWVMSRNTIIILIYRCHKMLEPLLCFLCCHCSL
jgi:hypothetical protein